MNLKTSTWDGVMIKHIYNGDCIANASNLSDESVDLMICDPPFGIGEATFDKHYARGKGKVIDGYQEAPDDYALFSKNWMSEATRVLKPNGSMFIIIGHTNLRHVLNAAAELGLYEINHAIWKYNFGVNTKTKFVTSHYHVLYYAKNEKNRTFNLNCRFGSQEKDNSGGSLLFQDIEDVFYIKKEYSNGKQRNKNKLPNELIQKIIMYCSNEGDTVVDFFLGNFTTACVAKSLGREHGGFEINKLAYEVGCKRLEEIEYGQRLKEMPKVVNINPTNQGSPLTEEDKDKICLRFAEMRLLEKYTVAKSNEKLQVEFGRGKFSIVNILKDKERVLKAEKKVSSLMREKESGEQDLAEMEPQ